MKNVTTFTVIGAESSTDLSNASFEGIMKVDCVSPLPLLIGFFKISDTYSFEVDVVNAGVVTVAGGDPGTMFSD